MKHLLVNKTRHRYANESVFMLKTNMCIGFLPNHVDSSFRVFYAVLIPNAESFRASNHMNEQKEIKNIEKSVSKIILDPNSRTAPNEPPNYRNDSRAYTISEARLADLRKEFLYWYFDKGGSNEIGDYQRDIHASMPQLHKNFNFQLPFYGFRFNYTRVSQGCQGNRLLLHIKI